MTKSATDLMGEIVFSAVLDSMMALKGAAKGLPNALWRDVSALHLNTTLQDLPPEVQAAIGDSVRTAFAKLRQGGYTVAPGTGTPERRPAPGGASTGGRPTPAGGRPGGPPRPRAKPATPPTVETRKRPQLRPDRTPPGKGS